MTNNFARWVDFYKDLAADMDNFDGTMEESFEFFKDRIKEMHILRKRALKEIMSVTYPTKVNMIDS